MSDPITEDSIRARLAADQVKPSRLATWDEIAYLLARVDASEEDAAEDARLIEHLQGQNARLRGVLDALQRSIAVIATAKGPQ